MKKQGNSENVKSIVLEELARKWPLSIRQMQQKVIERKRSVTYHAVHKAASQLAEQGVLIKRNGTYLISPDWTGKIAAMIEDIKKSYMNTKPTYLPRLRDIAQEEGTRTFTFENLEKADDYKKQLQWEYLISTGIKAPYCATVQHLRSPIIASERALNIMSIANKAQSEAFMLVAGSTQIDEWCADYYRDAFVKVQTGVSCAENCETCILGDIVLQLYIPESTQKTIDRMYLHSRDIGSINRLEFYSIYKRSTGVKTSVTRNAEIARQLRKQVLERFKRERLAIFDVNGTLVDGFLVTDFADYLALRDLFDRDILEDILALDKAYKEGVISFTTSSKKIIEKYGKGLAGKDAVKITRAARDFIEEGRLPVFRFSKRLFNMANSYCRTLIITKGTPEITEALRSVFPYDFALTSILQIKKDKYTGKVAINLAGKGVKEAVLRKFLKEQRAVTKGSFGFGHSHHDISFLSRVDFPHVINPTKGMKEIAKRKGWKIYHEGALDKDIFTDLRQGLKTPIKT